jgi:hypothetical protein
MMFANRFIQRRLVEFGVLAFRRAVGLALTGKMVQFND